MTFSELSPPLNHSLDLGRDMEVFVDQEAMKSLQQFCKPVEFYNIIQHRQPMFLRKNLSYTRGKRQLDDERGKVMFYYLYYFNTRWKIQVTENFSCPFCLISCSSFRGLQSHLDASHDLFHFEYSVTEGTSAVIVTCKSPGGIDLKIKDRDADPLKCFFYWRRKTKTRRAKLRVPGTLLGRDDRTPLIGGAPQAFRTSQPTGATASKAGATLPTKQRARKSILECQSSAPPDLPKGSLIRANATRFASALQKMQKHPAAADRNRTVAEPNNGSLLEKRQFYHSHTCQPMSRSHVFADHDSEDEVDDAIVSWEGRQLLDDFIDVSKDEKDVFHRWNDFVRRQRIVADCHCPGACVAFAKLNAADFNKSPSLRRCFMFMLIRFFEYRLIQGDTVDECLGIVDEWPRFYTRIKSDSGNSHMNIITTTIPTTNNNVLNNNVNNINNNNASIGSQALVMIQ